MIVTFDNSSDPGSGFTSVEPPQSMQPQTDFTLVDPPQSAAPQTDFTMVDPPQSTQPQTGFTMVDPPQSAQPQTGFTMVDPPDAVSPVTPPADSYDGSSDVEDYVMSGYDYTAPDVDDTDYSIYDDPGFEAGMNTHRSDTSIIPLNDFGSASGGGSDDGGSGGSVPPAKIPAPKDPRYVTKGFLVVCLIVTIIISAAIGAVAGTMISRNSGGTASREDSKLTELNLGDSTGSDLTVAEIVKKNKDAVVEIVVSGTRQGAWGQMELTQGAGSGVIITEDGYIATNHHVIEGASKVTVTLHNGDSYPATIIGSDASNDIAVIKIEGKDLTTAEIGDSSTVQVGDLAVAIGNPLGQLGGTATEGIISALDRTLTIEGTTLTLMQTDAAINGGNSGGGLFNGKGELIGIVESKASAVGVEGLAFALPINTVAEIINNFIENGGEGVQKAGTPAVGITISDVSEENAQYYNLESAGVYVAQVTGANAQKAGFQEGDRIISFNGEEIDDSNEFITLVRKCKVGDTVTIVVSRNGQQMEIKTELEALILDQ